MSNIAIGNRAFQWGISGPTVRIWWKASRQLMPLIGVLCLLAIAPALLTRWVNGRWSPDFNHIATMIPPVLFACGAGAVLIGLERESRGIEWLRTLPISPSKLTLQLYLIGAFYLGLLWIGALVLQLILEGKALGQYTPASSDFDKSYVLFVLVQSIYLFVCGYAMAWIFNSILVSLLALIPLTAILALANFAVAYFQMVLGKSQSRIFADPSSTVIYTNLAIGIVILACCGYRAAIGELTGQPMGLGRPSIETDTRVRSRFLELLSWPGEAIRNVARRLRGDSVSRSGPATVNGSLVWLFFHQHLGGIVSLLALISVIPTIFYFVSLEPLSSRRPNAWSPLSTLARVLWCSSLCWSALLSFQGEQGRSQIAFLSQQGITSSRIWWTRHIIPSAMVSIGALFVGVWLRTGMIFDVNVPGLASQTYAFAILAVGIGYAISQWISQLIRSTLMAVLVAPFLSLYLIYFVWKQAEMDVQAFIWGGLSFILMPLVATYWQTPRWMVGLRGRGFWLYHALFAVISIVIWGVGCLSTKLATDTALVFTGRLVSRDPNNLEAKGKLLLAATAYPATESSIRRVEVSPPSGLAEVKDKESVQERLDNFSPEKQRQRRDDFFIALDRQVGDGKTAIWVDRWLHGQLIWWLGRVHQATASAISKPNDADSDEALQEYQKWMEMGQRLIAGLRLSTRMMDQEMADAIEIIWLSELSNNESAEWLDETLRVSILEQLSDSAARWQSRRKALLVTYRDHITPQQFGNLMDIREASPSAYEWVRNPEPVVETLLDYIDRSMHTEVPFPAEFLTEATKEDQMFYGLGSNGPYFRIDDLDRLAGAPIVSTKVPATQWGAGWEKVAARLLKEAKSQ